MLGRHDSIDDIAVHSDGLELRGSLGVPPAPVGIVVFAHGSGSSRSSPRNRYVAQALRARGLATLLIDLLTEAEEHVDRIDASLRFDVELLAERLRIATEWVRHDSNLGHLPIAYFGASTGAAAALLAASRSWEGVCALVSRGGRPDLAGAALASVHTPALFIVGGADHAVLDLNRDAITRMQVQTQLAIVPGATHLFEEPGALDEVAQLAGEWIVEHVARTFVDPRRENCRQFADRREAGARLAELLHHHAGRHALVFGLPRGGLPVADELAKALGAPLDVWLVRKLGMPAQPELGMGAIAEGAALALDPTLVRLSGATARELRELVHRKAVEIRRLAERYRGHMPPPDVRGKTAILVDDGVATGGTLRAAIRGARRRGAAQVVVAAPIAAADAISSLRTEADELACLSTPHHLIAVGAWYEDFHQLDDDEVVAILTEARKRTQSGLPATAA
jgi:predicted phosphoribosyltransferase/alpha-beta hydrolase superfamily lysophospholipase